MSAHEVAAARRQAREIVLGQLAITVLLVGLCGVGWGWRAAGSALAGGGIGMSATAYMAFALLRHGAGTQAARIARDFFLGWTIKVLMTVALLGMAFRSKQIEPVPLLATYVATLFAYWIAAARGSRHENSGGQISK